MTPDAMALRAVLERIETQISRVAASLELLGELARRQDEFIRQEAMIDITDNVREYGQRDQARQEG